MGETNLAVEGAQLGVPPVSLVCQLAQFIFRHGEFRYATIQADNNLRKYPNDSFINIFQFGEMDAHFRTEFLPVDRTTRLAGHTATPPVKFLG
jgi:hypothetical protein